MSKSESPVARETRTVRRGAKVIGAGVAVAATIVGVGVPAAVLSGAYAQRKQLACAASGSGIGAPLLSVELVGSGAERYVVTLGDPVGPHGTQLVGVVPGRGALQAKTVDVSVADSRPINELAADGSTGSVGYYRSISCAPRSEQAALFGVTPLRTHGATKDSGPGVSAFVVIVRDADGTPAAGVEISTWQKGALGAPKLVLPTDSPNKLWSARVLLADDLALYDTKIAIPFTDIQVDRVVDPDKSTKILGVNPPRLPNNHESAKLHVPMKEANKTSVDAIEVALDKALDGALHQ